MAETQQSFHDGATIKLFIFWQTVARNNTSVEWRFTLSIASDEILSLQPSTWHQTFEKVDLLFENMSANKYISDSDQIERFSFVFSIKSEKFQKEPNILMEITVISWTTKYKRKTPRVLEASWKTQKDGVCLSSMEQ